MPATVQRAGFADLAPPLIGLRQRLLDEEIEEVLAILAEVVRDAGYEVDQAGSYPAAGMSAGCVTLPMRRPAIQRPPVI